MRYEWDVAYANTGQDALNQLAQESFDVVVSDMCMTEMSGVELLRYVYELYPRIVRIALSGYTDTDIGFQALKFAHQFISKPCDADKLKAAIQRACGMQEIMGNQELQQLVSRMKTVPSLPTLYSELTQEIDSPDASPGKIGQIIARDIGMSAKILQLANSAFFGLSGHISSPAQAVVLLGLDTIRSLVLSVSIFDQFNKSILERLSLHNLWNHSLTVATFSRCIVQGILANRKEADNAFIAGILHDIGKLILASNFPGQYFIATEVANRKKVGMDEAERSIFGVSHAKVGAYLLGIWGLPAPTVDAVAFHHHPGLYNGEKSLSLTAVHLANTLDYDIYPKNMTGVKPIPDTTYLFDAGLGEDLAPWRDYCKDAVNRGEGYE